MPAPTAGKRTSGFARTRETVLSIYRYVTDGQAQQDVNICFMLREGLSSADLLICLAMSVQFISAFITYYNLCIRNQWQLLESGEFIGCVWGGGA